MIDPASQLPFVPPTAGARPPASATPANTVDPAGAARGARFQALLEDLDTRARAMSKSARESLSAEALPQAVESARASLEDALELSRSLLEAFRQSSAQAPAGKIERP